jgi:hypothetical protein
MSTLNDIPFEVFSNTILPCLSAVDVGRLAQANTIWRDFTSDKIVWKQLYLQLTPGKILDSSIHIGPKVARIRNSDKEYEIFRTTGVTTTVYREGYPFVPHSTRHCTNSTWFLHHSWCCNCMPKELKDTLKSWREIRTDGIQSDNFPHNQLPDLRNTYITTDYCAYVKSEWEKYNRQRGLSTVNLCQNPDHYSIDTLGTLEDCKKKRSFKKATLKILEKAPKAELAKATREKKSKLRRLEKARQAIRQLEIECHEAEKKETQAKKAIETIQVGISLA